MTSEGGLSGKRGESGSIPRSTTRFGAGHERVRLGGLSAAAAVQPADGLGSSMTLRLIVFWSDKRVLGGEFFGSGRCCLGSGFEWT